MFYFALLIALFFNFSFDNFFFFRKEDEKGIKKYFPKAKFTYIPDAGHWVHADKPQEFLKIIISFMQNSNS